MSNNIMDIMAFINDEIPAHVQDDVFSLLDTYGASLIKPPTTIKDILNFLLEKDSAGDLAVLELTDYDLNALGNNYEDNLNVSGMVARSQQSQQMQLIGPMLQIGDYTPATTDQTTTLTTEEDNFFVDPDDGTIVYLPTDLGETVAQTPQIYSRSDKENQEEYECMICRRTFRRHHHFKQHMKLHDPISYECKVCQLVFDSRHYYDLHVKSHTPPKSYACELCDSTFTNKLHLTYHLTSHRGEEPYKCKVCDMKFQLKYCLDQHAKLHLDLPFKCDVCIRSFKYQYLLDRHIVTHSDNKKLCKDPLKKQKILSSNMQTS